jgi:hypothetical protein
MRFKWEGKYPLQRSYRTGLALGRNCYGWGVFIPEISATYRPTHPTNAKVGSCKTSGLSVQTARLTRKTVTQATYQLGPLFRFATRRPAVEKYMAQQ